MKGDWKTRTEVDSLVEKLGENVVDHIDAEIKKCKKMQSADVGNFLSL